MTDSMYLVGYARVRVAHDYYAHCEAELIYKRSITTLAEWNLHRAELELYLQEFDTSTVALSNLDVEA